MGTDAQTEEGDRKGPVRQRHKSGRAAADGCPSSLPGGTLQVLSSPGPKLPFFSTVPITTQKYRPSLSSVRLTT